MTEKTFWRDHLQPVLHEPSLGRVAWKVQDAFRKGLPDVDCAIGGHSYKIELKYAKKWPVRDTTTLDVELTKEQHRYLDEWSGAAGRGASLVLIGVGREWLLLDYETARERRLPEVLYERAHASGTLDDLTPLLQKLEEGV